jgi:rare lipoprotein A
MAATPAWPRRLLAPVAPADRRADFPWWWATLSDRQCHFRPQRFDEFRFGGLCLGHGRGAISAAHHTLPVPSYAEVTDINTGRTILVRVERRGPMDSPMRSNFRPGGGATGVSAGSNTPVRVRRSTRRGGARDAALRQSRA